MLNFIVKISFWIIPVFLLIVFFHAYYKGIKIFDEFVQGGKEGFSLAIRLIPYIVGIYVGIGVFRASGAMDLLLGILSPVLNLLKIPGEIFPLMITRPLSGPAALGIAADIMARHGADSFIGRLASTVNGSTDTTLYILTVYFASVGVKKARYSLPVGLMTDFAAFMAAIFICNLVFK